MQEKKQIDIVKDIQNTADAIADKLLFNKKEELISLINKAGKLDNSREMAIAVLNSLRNQRLIQECIAGQRFDIPKDINQALIVNFGHIVAVKKLLDNDKEQIKKLIDEKQKKNKISAKKSLIYLLLLILAGGTTFYFQDEENGVIKPVEVEKPVEIKETTKKVENTKIEEVREVKSKDIIANNDLTEVLVNDEVLKKEEQENKEDNQKPKTDLEKNNSSAQENNQNLEEKKEIQTRYTTIRNSTIRDCPKVSCDVLGLIPLGNSVIPLPETNSEPSEGWLEVEYNGRFCNNPKDSNCSSRSNTKIVQGWIQIKNLEVKSISD